MSNMWSVLSRVTSVLAVLMALLARGDCAFQITDEEYGRFPRLYHLDDYNSCLAKSEGLYCVGSFNIQPPKHHDPTYELMKEYSLYPFHFNRTQLHRGYCVSERCPSSERNTTLRFEQCATHWGKKQKLRLSLASFKYCKAHAQEYARNENPEPYDLTQKILLTVVVVLCVANFLGTGYDVLLGDGAKKTSVLAEWSIRSNWRRLTASYEGGEPRLNDLSPVQGVRVLLMIIIIGTHAGCIHDMLYLQNPRYVETVVQLPAFMIFMNGTSVVMVFVMVSTFLLAYNLLLFSQRHQLSFGMLPLCLLKRVARISPVYLLVVGFAATLWPSMRAGPMWPTLVERESRICRDKFWSHAFYINNLVQPDDHCLVQTWFLATDMQLYIVATVLTVWLSKKGLMALPILAALTVASCLLNGVLAYYFEWQSLLYHVYPSTMHTMYKGVTSFYRMYTTPWGSLPACLVGLFLAHLHFEFQQRGIKPAHYTLFRIAYNISPILIVGWMMAGVWVREYTDPVFTAAFVSLERPVLSILAATTALGLFNSIPGFWLNYFGWSGFHAMGRMSLSVLMVHWIISSCIAASRPQPISTSLLDVTVDSLATAVMSYIVAIPLSIMVEMPMTRTINVLVFKPIEQANKHKMKATSAKSQNIISTEICNSLENSVDSEIYKNKVSSENDQEEATIQTVRPQVDAASDIELEGNATVRHRDITDDDIVETGEDSTETIKLQDKEMDSNHKETAHNDAFGLQEENTDRESIDAEEEAIGEISRPQEEITISDDSMLKETISETTSCQENAADSNALGLQDETIDNEAVEAQEHTDPDIFIQDTSEDKVDGLFRTLIVVMRRTFKVI